LLASSLTTLGSFRLQIGDRIAPPPATHKARALLAHLVFRKNTDVAREAIAELFWPGHEPDRARANLKTATWAIRRAIRSTGADPADFLRVTRATMRWTAPTVLDAAEFLHLADDTSASQRALNLYAGSFLEGYYDDWTVLERERIDAAYERLLSRLLASRRDAEIARTLLERNPYSEEAYAVLIESEFEAGRPQAARDFLERARATLGELGVAPLDTLESRFRITRPRRVPDFERIAEMFYDAALEPSAWDGALAELARAMNARVCHLFAFNRRDGRPSFSYLGGDDDKETERLYLDRYAAIDPRRLIPAAPGSVFACHQYLDEAIVSKDETYQDFLIPRDYRYTAGTKLAIEDDTELIVGLNRAPRQGPFEEAELALLRDAILPHLRRAARLHHKIRGAQLEAAMEAAIVVVDRKGRVLASNPAAERLIARDDGALSRAVADAATHAMRDTEVVLRPSRSLRPLRVTAVPAAERAWQPARAGPSRPD